MDEETLKLIGKIIGTIIGIFLNALIVMYLWNYLMPVVFGLTTLTYFQSWCLIILARHLFGHHYHIKDKEEKGE